MRIPAWLGGGHARGRDDEMAADDFSLRESRQERDQIRREHIEMQARIQSLREIAEFLGHIAQK